MYKLPSDHFAHKRAKLFGALLAIQCMATVNNTAIAFVSQSKIKLHDKEYTLAKFAREIERQSSYVFLYDNSQINDNQKILIHHKDGSIEEILDDNLKELSYSYKIVNNTIVLKRKIDRPQANQQTVQQYIKGKVVDMDGTPLSGVTVRNTNNGRQAETNSQGEFTIEAAPAQQLSFSSVGYETVNNSISGNAFLTVQLKTANNQLEQIVVVGFGTQKKKDITGAIATMSTKDIEDRPVTQLASAMEGKMAGVEIVKSSGQPQAGFSIRVRGTSTITAGSNPLYILDGVPTENISELNPSDIQSISVLKDAASAAVYGSSGANGVVLITTKRGNNGKTLVNFETYQGFSTIWKRPKVLNAAQYKELMTEVGEAADWSKYSADTNWPDQLFRTGHSQKYQASVRGGDEKTGFYISGSYQKDNGTVITNTVNKVNFKVNLDHQINKIFKVGTSLSYNRWYDVDIPENARNGVIMNAYLGSPVIGIYGDKGAFTVDPFYTDLDNPVALATGNEHYYVNNRFTGNFFVEANIFPELKFKSLFGYEKYNNQYRSFVDPFRTTEGRKYKGRAQLDQQDNQYWMSENTLNYDKTFSEKHHFTGLLGYITTKTQTTGSSISTQNFANPAIRTVNGGSMITEMPSAKDAAVTTVSGIAKIGYDYNGTYLLTANLRADASSVFGPNNRWGCFPSFSAGWRISNEGFFEAWKNTVNDLKLRASWGKVGNSQIPAFAYLGLIDVTGSYVIGDQVVPGYTPITLDNPNLKWETTNQTDIGIDASFLNSRLTVAADYYAKKTIGLLLDSRVPYSSGYAKVLRNLGDLQNKGFELELSSRNFVHDFKWNTTLTFGLNRNKVLNIDGGTYYDGNIDGRGNSTIAKEGLALGSFWGYVAKGVNPETGDMIYQMADPDAGLQTSDMNVIGNATPKFSYGMTNDFSYRNFNLSFFLQGVQGNDILNATRIYTEGMWEPRNQSATVLDRWSPTNKNSTMPRPDLNNTEDNYNTKISSRFVEKGSYLRLKSLTLGYTIPKQVLEKWKMNKLRFYVTGENLLTFTKYSGLDPEVSMYSATNQYTVSSNMSPGIDFGTSPQARTFIVGLNLTF
ncbi:TonB-dependent receptor [Sphingobacterium sp. HMA12]|uniref:TonB-dependent receptor n=1 Tax=Sphingobacterium sp. HMA12 TaxID=2050894 RepID=UPI000CE9EBB2|nr:TonB-dependent receptor [Sphingobacterium sp. HMA12]